MIGYGPLPQEGLKQIPRAILRTRQILKGVLEGGHTVNLFTLPLPGGSQEGGEPASMVPDQYEGLQFQRFTKHSGEFSIRTLNEQVRQLEPDAIVGINTYPAYVGAMLSTTVPLWCDLNGFWMAEMQARCAAESDDSRLVGAWAIERTMLRRLDKFSAVSRPQLYAVLGEMAGIGRFNKFTFDYSFGSHVPNAVEPLAFEAPREAEMVLRGPIVPEDAFIVLWSGAFNLWADIDNLVQAMNDLMSHHERVHFVSTGGKLAGADTRTYQKFEDIVAASPYRERFHLMGWVEAEKLPRIYREADVGINVDLKNYETLFGGRTRIHSMAAEGLVVVTTLGTEISEWLLDGDAALTAPMNDAPALVEAIEPFVVNPEGLVAYRKRAKRMMETDFSISQTTRGLRKWLEAPKLAPDNEAKVKNSQGEIAELGTTSINALESQSILLDSYDPRTLMQTKRELDTIRRKTWYRVFRKLGGWLGE